MFAFVRNVRSYFRRPTIIESLLVIAIILLLTAALLPGLKWASSGEIRFPVRVLVFDAIRGMPIANADVKFFRAPPLTDSKSLEAYRDRFDPKTRNSSGDRSVTDADGAVVIDFKFTTGANHERPTPHAHVRYAWVHVQAEGFGGVVVPVRQDSMSTASLREQKELLVTVGLIPVK